MPERLSNPFPRIGAATLAIIAGLVMIVGLSLLVVSNLETSSNIQKESTESHLLAEMQTALTTLEARFIAWEQRPESSVHPVDDPTVAIAIADFKALFLELAMLIDSEELAEIQEFSEAFDAYAGAVLATEGGVDSAQYREINALSLAVRQPLLELLREENDHLIESVEADRRSDVAVSWGFPALLVLGLIALFFVLRLQRNSRQVDEMRRINDARSEFIASVSHELRTPLTPVVALSHELRDRTAEFSQEELSEFAATIARESDEVAAIVNDLLVAARFETGQISVAAQTLNVKEQIEHALATVAEPETVAVEASGSVVADSGRLRQILRNLVTNAQHYGGRDIRISTHQANGTMQITVADSGPGIPPALRERIFEAYSSAHEDQGMPASVGLGLTVSRSLATLMDGSLSYHHVDGWSRMVLRLPADSEARTAASHLG